MQLIVGRWIFSYAMQDSELFTAMLKKAHNPVNVFKR
jgi:hypothetical protein